ncbi:hypothetical protein FCULG_00012812 [Fusarium culmorum]|uniref:Uncharacterized protein n=1 Tax=Fusarium culmorum TaxID=5516 RepID=A0A2T4GIR3_FUSCU|nr:hypothetical protein FCULG_00012812 [Fusarium culmorum]
MGLRCSDGQNVLASCNQVSRNVFLCVAVVFPLFHPSRRRPSFKRPKVAAMEDDSQPFDPTRWDYSDLDFRTPQLSGINSRGVSLADPSPSPSQHQRSRLPLLQLDDWDPDDTYDESPPTSVHYSIEWKLQLRKGRLSKLTNDTEQNHVLAPGALWEMTLKNKVDRLLRQKTPRGKKHVPEETIVVVSVTDRSERDLTKRFDELNIDWQMVEEQLYKWSPLFRAGKKLRVDISFICKEEPQGSRRDQLLETQEAAGQPRVWKDVYDLMRYNRNLCPGSYCYVNEQRKHIRLNTSILTKMVKYAKQGNELRIHRDMPPYILDMIYEKNRLDGEQRVKQKAASLESDHPIKIVNVLPSPYGYSATDGCTPPSSNYRTASLSVVDLTDLVIPKPIDRAIDDYTEWLCDQVEDKNWKAGFRSTGSITRVDCLDLRHVYQDRDIGYYVNQGVKAGIARSFVEDIKIWADSL